MDDATQPKDQDSNPTEAVNDPTSRQDGSDTHEEISPAAEQASRSFVGRWHRLVSTTNWEKGRIIDQWRDSLKAEGATTREYSDETWSRLVGCVTSQHVGRLRRVFRRFGGEYQKYESLYWSHFQAALDWDDAEMYLEGAVLNGWSVAQMRRTRWEAMGQLEADRPVAEDVVAAELDEDFEPATQQPPESGVISPSYDAVADPDAQSIEGPDFGDEDEPTAARALPDTSGEPGASEHTVRPFENLAELPDDVSEAFEAFKLAILRHKANQWRDISLDEMLGTLESLKELALAPSGDEDASGNG